jgi:NADPH:quinone reductase-like Zn-dependent oxidoreductase
MRLLKTFCGAIRRLQDDRDPAGTAVTGTTWQTEGPVMRELHVSKHNLKETRHVDVEPAPLAEGQARLRVELFGLTSNNLTYAAMGAGYAGYWDFFPGTEDWGRPPAWGFATVIDSRAAGVDTGSRYFGFVPIGQTFDVTPARAGARGFVDAAPHRAGKSIIYNQYLDTRTDPAYVAAFEEQQALVRPLYASGWWVAERVRLEAPETVLISSASSKTAMAAAHRLRRSGAASLVALTSTRHAALRRRHGAVRPNPCL